MKKGPTLKGINHSYHSHMRRLTKSGRESEILFALSSGKNTYLRMDRLESSSFDSSWIEVIENVIFDLGEIIANPRQVTKTEGNIVPIELARKTSAESVQHLASHTQYIKEIDEYGNVIPSKILTLQPEDDIKTYENRFIATFVRRLVLFIEKRYEFVSKFAELHDESVLMFKNKSIVEGAEVEIETKIKINRKSEDEVSLKNVEYVGRIKQMREYILYFYNSPFMKQLKTEKDVHNPILQTNIIRKNPLYHHCYEVYRFIEKYEHLGVHYKVDEQYSIFNDEELAEINHTLFANYITLKGKEPSKIHKGTVKVYKPKILTSLDDEAFIYGPLFAGPIEFLRIDEPYQKYLDSKVRKDLPLHPTKKEKEYYADEYAQKQENKEDLKQKNDLIKRKNKEVNAFNKAAAKIDQEREEARLKLLQQEKEIIKKEEDDLLTAARNEIIAASLKEHEQETYERRLNEINSTKVVEPSHPHQDPVTYDEAVLQIWPQIANAPKPSKKKAPAKKAEKKAEPVQEQPIVQEPVKEQPVVEAPAQQPVPQPAEVKEYSHPYSKPVTYDEAALEIWPALANAPTLRVAPKEEAKPVKVKKAPVKKAAPQPVEQPKPQPQPVEVKEYSHPYSEPVTYEEAALEIWPQIANAPALRVAPKEEAKPIKVKKAPAKKAVPVQEEQPKVEEVPVMEETPKEAKPRKKTVKAVPQPSEVKEYKHPYTKPVSYDEAALEIWPQMANAPALRVTPQEEKQPAPASAPVKKESKPKAKKAPQKKESKPEPAPQPVEEPKEAPKKAKAKPKQKPAPQKEEQPAPVQEEPVVEAPKKAPKAKKAPEKKPEPQPEPVSKPEPKPAPKKPVLKKAPVKKAEPKKAPAKKPAPQPKPVEKPREKIPGRFIVKTHQGYYVNQNKYSVYKEDAKIFDDFNLAKDIKKARGGKVIKL